MTTKSAYNKPAAGAHIGHAGAQQKNVARNGVHEQWQQKALQKLVRTQGSKEKEIKCKEVCMCVPQAKEAKRRK